ncbi:MAG TPA: type III restriction endonuclease subunit R, partial [Thermopetrobacter sp.]|nr:type III restriction endonuclease subunit R [Thermopetrobacter sp.]
PDFTEKAWERLREAGRLPASRKNIPFSPRRDGIGRPVPNAVLKIPTGGGKTWLAVNALSRVFGSFVGRNSGFVLWIVPNEAIYAQTLKRLRDRADPYRQALDMAAAGRVRILEKDDTLNRMDVEANLCVMVLMLQAANRQTKDVLRMFRDRGDVHGFTPPEGDERAHKEQKARIPNLDTYDLADSAAAGHIKDSLGNALRIIRPVVVMDEGHKATSDLAYETLYGFNPQLVLELTATPKDVKARGGKNPRPARFANVLAEVSGLELDREGMIKMPINLETRREEDWRITLRKAVQRLQGIRRAAEEYQANGGRYIRPIMLVQVERTGKEQMDAGFIHANDVKDWLLQAGFDEAEIAIKTAEQNDLNQPENQDLLSPLNRVRVIITKQALQEGWDAPFAYLLCSLSANANVNAMTQLVGRILRQPHAMKTGVAALDECWVIAHHAETARVVEAVKKGLENDGLGDLVLQVAQEDAQAAGVARRIPRREKFAKLKVFLPLVLHVGDDGVRELDYDTDILAAIDWCDYDPAEVAKRIPTSGKELETLVQRLSLTDGDDLIARQVVRRAPALARFDPAHAARMISEIVPNAFQAREIVGRLLAALHERGLEGDKLGPLSEFIIDTLSRALEEERLKRAEEVFRRKVEEGGIRFRLRLDGR